MNRVIFIYFVFLFSFSSFAQVGIGTTTPDSTAALDIQHPSKGFLMPRITLAQRDGIQGPAEGLQIYNTTNNRPEIFSQGRWQALNYSSQYYYKESANDLDGLVQTDTLDYTCLTSGDNYIQIEDFDIDTITGSSYYLLTYQGRQFFFGYELPCTGNSSQEVLVKLDSNQNLIWAREIAENNGGSNSSFFLRHLNNGYVILSLRCNGPSFSLSGQNFTQGVGSYIICLSEAGAYLYHKWISNAVITYLGKNQLNSIGYIYSLTAEMISPGPTGFTTIWSPVSTTASQIFSSTVNPYENNIYIYTGAALRMLSSSGEQNIVNLGSSTNALAQSPQSDGIIVTNSNIQLTTPPTTSFTFNGTTYSGVLHITISRTNNQILNITRLSEVSTNSGILNYCVVSDGSGLIETYRENWLAVNRYDINGNRIFSSRSPYWDSNSRIKSIRNNKNKIIFSGDYSPDAVGRGFLRFNFPPIGGNSVNYFLYSLILP